jgi:glyoxylase-like metal-dependent hydrolase (beta-lactamase superfamily II)
LFAHTYKSEINEIEGIHQIKITVPFPVKYVCVYIFQVDNSYVMFDAGLDMGSWAKKFFSALDKIGISLKEIDYCFISHEHTDHTGLMKAFKKINPNIQIAMSEATHETLKWETDPENYFQLEEEAKKIAKEVIRYGISEKEGKRLVDWFTMWPKLRRYHKPDMLLHDGDEIAFKTNKLRIIWTPGHALGHICVFDQKKRYLFAGDHILSRITPHIGNFLVDPELNEKYDFEDILYHYLNSLERIDKLNPKIIFPAHQDVIYNPHERIQEIQKHHEKRLAEISSVIKENPLTPYEISQLHFGDDLDEMNSFLALSEVMGHLIYLENNNKVHRIEKEDKIFFVS